MQLTFATRPAALTGLSHDLRTDERVMRYTLLRRPAVPPIKARELRVLRRDLAAGAAVRRVGGEDRGGEGRRLCLLASRRWAVCARADSAHRRSDEAEEEWEEEFEEEEDTAAEGVAASEPPALEPATHQPGLDGSGRAQRRHADAADGESAAEGVAQPSASALPLPAAPASSPAAPP